MLDLVLVGDSLSIGVVAWRLLQRRPEIVFAVLEQRTSWADRGWSFRGTDLSKAQLEWLWILGSLSWPSFDVVTRTRTRRIGGGFHFIRGDELHRKLAERLGDRLRTGIEVAAITDRTVTLTSGETIDAKAVIDGRTVSTASSGDGYRQDLRFDCSLSAPHRFEVPLGLDLRASPAARVSIVPLDAQALVVEVQRFASSPSFDEAIEPIVRSHLAACGLSVTKLSLARTRIESLGRPPRATERPVLTTTAHPLGTSEVAEAAAWAELIGDTERLEAATLAPLLHDEADRRWHALHAVRAFASALPTHAEPLLERSSRLPEDELSRLLVGQPSLATRLRLFGMLGATAGLAEAIRRWNEAR